MTTLTTLTRTSEPTAETTAALVEIRSAKGQTATVKVWQDGSAQTVDGARWLLDATRKTHGSRHVTSALVAAATTGAATLEG